MKFNSLTFRKLKEQILSYKLNSSLRFCIRIRRAGVRLGSVIESSAIDLNPLEDSHLYFFAIWISPSPSIECFVKMAREIVASLGLAYIFAFI